MMMLGEITEPQAVFSQLTSYAGLWETVSPSFGPLLGSKVRLPRRPELWSLQELAAFKQAQSRKVRTYRDEFERLWEGVYKARGHVFGDDYWLRRSKSLPTDLIRELEREWLQLEPEVARYAIARTRPGISPEAVLAGDNLFQACKAFAMRAKGVDHLPVRGIEYIDSPLEGDAWPFQRDGQYVMLPFGIMVVKCQKSLYLRPKHRDWFPGMETEWLRISASHSVVKHLREAVVMFVRELLKASATISFTLPEVHSPLDLKSEPVIGIVQNAFSRSPGGKSVATVIDDKLYVRYVVQATCPMAMWKYTEQVEQLVDLIIDQWHQRSHHAGDDWERLCYISLAEHTRLVKPLVAEEPWFSGDADALLQYARQVHPTIRNHIDDRGGSYVVTRHDMTCKQPLTITTDVTLAIGVALAHHTDHTWSLGLTAS